MIVNRYLVREIGKPLAAILGILIVLFASYSAADVLSDAVNGLLPADTIAALIGLKVLIALEVLIPISLYLSVVLAFGRLYGDTEFTAMFSLGVTPGKVMGAVLNLSKYLAIIVAALSLLVRPWAYQKLHELSARAAVMLNVNAMEAGNFYIGQNGDRVIFVANRAGPGAPGQDVFVQIKYSDHTEIIYAPLAAPLPQGAPGGEPDVYMSHAHIYEIANANGQADQILNAQGITLHTDKSGGVIPPYSAVAASTVRLATSHAPADVAEFQWRLSTPLSTVLLGFLGIPLSRARPRQSKYAKFGTAILVYSGYYLLCTSARTWVQHGEIASFPGIWWVPALLALFLLLAMYGPDLLLRYRPERQMRTPATPVITVGEGVLAAHDAA